MRATLMLLLLSGAAACHHEKTPTAMPPDPVAAAKPSSQIAPRPMTHDCPTEVPGTTVNVDRFDGGIALVFTTLIGDVNDLRGRVHHTADQVNHENAATGTEPIAHAMIDVPSNAAAVDIDGGARLELRPASEADLDRLRSAAEQRATQLASGQCTPLQPPA